MVEHIGKIFEESANNIPSISGALEEVRVLSTWRRTISGKVAQNSVPERFAGGIIYLTTKNASWSQELSALKGTMIENVNKALGGEVITDIRFKTGIINEKNEEKIKKNKKKCAKCGIDHEGKDKLCHFCIREEKENETSFLCRALNKKPWLSYDHMRGTITKTDSDGFLRIKREFKNRTLDQLITGKDEIQEERWERLLIKYTELLLGKEIGKIDAKQVKGVRQAVQNKINNRYRAKTLKH